MKGTKFRGKDYKSTLPIHCFIDSKTLYDSIYSTKQAQEVNIRGLVAWIKEQLTDGVIKDVSWLDTNQCWQKYLLRKMLIPRNS